MLRPVQASGACRPVGEASMEIGDASPVTPYGARERRSRVHAGGLAARGLRRRSLGASKDLGTGMPGPSRGRRGGRAFPGIRVIDARAAARGNRCEVSSPEGLIPPGRVDGLSHCRPGWEYGHVRETRWATPFQRVRRLLSLLSARTSPPGPRAWALRNVVGRVPYWRARIPAALLW